MTDKIDDGGLAFPQPLATSLGGGMYVSCEKNAQWGGLTKRELFAAMAMQGLLHGAVGFIGNSKDPSAYAHGPCNADVAERSVSMADALLDALLPAPDPQEAKR